MKVGHFSGTEAESGKTGSEADAEVQLKKSSAKAIDVKEAMRVDSILAGIMRKVVNLTTMTFIVPNKHIWILDPVSENL